MNTSAPATDSSTLDQRPAWTTVVRDLRWPLLVLAAQLPMTTLHLYNMWLRPHHQYYPVVLLVVGFLIATRLTTLAEDQRDRGYRFPIVLLLLMSLVINLIATAIFSPWLAALGFVVACGATLLFLNRRYFLENSFGVWILLCLLVPLPGAYEQKLSLFLQRLTSEMSGRLLTMLGIPNLVEGTTMSLPDRQLFVAEACSGIVSMMAIVAACLMVAVYFNRAWIHTVLLVFSGLALASATNIVRIVTIAVADVKLKWDLTEGWQHDMLGFGLLALALALALSADQLIHYFLAPIDDELHADERKPRLEVIWDSVMNWGHPASQAEPAVGSQTSGFSSTIWKGLTAACLLVFSASGVFGAVQVVDHFQPQEFVPVPTFAKRFSAQSLPRQVDQWTLVDFAESRNDRLLAQDSRVWTYRHGDITALFSIDLSFDHWHDLNACYRGIGWTMGDQPQTCQANLQPDAIYLTSQFHKGQQERGALIYCLVDEEGQPFNPPQTLSIAEHLTRRLQVRRRTLSQLQLWCTAGRSFSDAEKESFQKLFETLRARTLTAIAGQSSENQAGGQ